MGEDDSTPNSEYCLIGDVVDVEIGPENGPLVLEFCVQDGIAVLVAEVVLQIAAERPGSDVDADQAEGERLRDGKVPLPSPCASGCRGPICR